MSEVPGTLFFTDLVDAVRYSQAWVQSLEEQKALAEKADKQLGKLGELSDRISAAFEGLELDREYLESLSKVINEFAATAIQQKREKLSAKLKAEVEDSAAASEAERLKAIRGLESYLAATPLPVLDEQVVLELSESSYSAIAEYKCEGKIEYEFLLNTANSALFRSPFTLSATHRGIKLPVRLGKTWLRKEAVPDFEKLDEYTLSTARASQNHLVSTFVNHETSASVSIVFSRSGSDSFVTAEYLDGKGKVDVTGEPALSKHLDLVSVKSAMAQLLDAISDLKKEKLKLNKLEADGKDIMGTLDCFWFMQRVTDVMVQSAGAMDEVRKLDPKMVEERLKLLGPNGNVIMDKLGISTRTPEQRRETP
ncbi:MAG: hypothetical protein OK474_10355 [Thaumarchaeota archaeon]|nr:hypothetical protein [Nitrososphaerota archaeon]